MCLQALLSLCLPGLPYQFDQKLPFVGLVHCEVLGVPAVDDDGMVWWYGLLLVEWQGTRSVGYSLDLLIMLGVRIRPWSSRVDSGSRPSAFRWLVGLVGRIVLDEASGRLRCSNCSKRACARLDRTCSYCVCFIGSNMNNINGCSQLLHGCIFWLGWTAKSIRRKFLRTRCSFPCAFCVVQSSIHCSICSLDMYSWVLRLLGLTAMGRPHWSLSQVRNCWELHVSSKRLEFVDVVLNLLRGLTLLHVLDPNDESSGGLVQDVCGGGGSHR